MVFKLQCKESDGTSECLREKRERVSPSGASIAERNKYRRAQQVSLSETSEYRRAKQAIIAERSKRVSPSETSEYRHQTKQASFGLIPR